MKKEIKLVCQIVGVYYLITSIISIACITYNKYVSIVFFPDTLMKTTNLSYVLLPTIIQSLLMIGLSTVLILFSRKRNNKTDCMDQNNTNDTRNSVDLDRLAILIITLLLIFHAINHITNSINADITSYMTMKKYTGKYISKYDFIKTFVKSITVGLPVLIIPMIELIICLKIFIKQLRSENNHKPILES